MAVSRCFFFVALMAVAAVANAQQSTATAASTPFWDSLGAGTHAVGFRVMWLRDHSRHWPKSTGDKEADPGRPIRVSLWYPASPSPGTHHMTYGDYLHHSAPPEYGKVSEQLDKADADSWLSDMRDLTPPGQPMLNQVFSTPAAAYLDAPAAPGRFPLLLYSGGKGSRADDNVELAEYLASYGDVVATVPQLGPSDKELELGSSQAEISLHTHDFEVALAELRKLADIDVSKIASAGHSAGGEAAVELAMRNPEIKAVIGLDASFGMTGGARIFQKLPEYAPGKQIGAVLLDLRRGDGAQGVKLNLDAIDALRWKDSYRITFSNAYHGDFTEWGMLAWKLNIPMPPNPYGHTRKIGYAVNQDACHVIRAFLDAEFGSDHSTFDRELTAMSAEPGIHVSHVTSLKQRGGTKSGLHSSHR
jgi:dienelactone hydrolase